MPVIWLNGRLLHAAKARIDPADRGLLLGDGVFETLRAEQRRPLHLDLHLARLRHGASVLGIDPEWDDDAIAGGIHGVLAAAPQDNAALRITLTRGSAPRGVLPPPGTRATLLIAAAALPEPKAPAHAIVAACTRRNEHSPLSRIKSLNYGDSILARQEAAARGADEAILLNTAGYVAEASAGNLFVRLEGVWLTPPVADGALPGIARALALQAGLAGECRLALPHLLTASSAAVSSSLGWRMLASIDGRALAVVSGHLGIPAGLKS